MQPIPVTSPGDAPPFVGETLKARRLEQRLSLDELSRRSGVSKSMLSQVERNEANPTVAILWRLAAGLGLEITDLLNQNKNDTGRQVTSLMSAHETPLTRSRDGMCRLRILSPIDMAGQVEWYELTIEPGGVLASDAHEKGCREHLTVSDGSLTVITIDKETRVVSGETARYSADVRHSIQNCTSTSAKALLVVQYLRSTAL